MVILDAEDLLHPEKLRQRQPLLSVCSYHRFEAEDLTVAASRQPPQRLDFGALLSCISIPCSGVIKDRTVLQGNGGLQPDSNED